MVVYRTIKAFLIPQIFQIIPTLLGTELEETCQWNEILSKVFRIFWNRFKVDLYDLSIMHALK